MQPSNFRQAVITERFDDFEETYRFVSDVMSAKNDKEAKAVIIKTFTKLPSKDQLHQVGFFTWTVRKLGRFFSMEFNSTYRKAYQHAIEILSKTIVEIDTLPQTLKNLKEGIDQLDRSIKKETKIVSSRKETLHLLDDLPELKNELASLKQKMDEAKNNYVAVQTELKKKTHVHVSTKELTASEELLAAWQVAKEAFADKELQIDRLESKQKNTLEALYPDASPEERLIELGNEIEEREIKIRNMDVQRVDLIKLFTEDGGVLETPAKEMRREEGALESSETHLVEEVAPEVVVSRRDQLLDKIESEMNEDLKQVWGALLSKMDSDLSQVDSFKCENGKLEIVLKEPITLLLNTPGETLDNKTIMTLGDNPDRKISAEYKKDKNEVNVGNIIGLKTYLRHSRAGKNMVEVPVVGFKSTPTKKKMTLKPDLAAVVNPSLLAWLPSSLVEPTKPTSEFVKTWATSEILTEHDVSKYEAILTQKV